MAGKRTILVLALIIAVIALFTLWIFSGGSGLFPASEKTGIQKKPSSVINTSRCAVQWFSGPSGKYVYMVTVIAPHGGHVITGEYLLNNLKGMKEWRFFQYENEDIQPGDWQMPYGNASQKTRLEIHKVTNLSVVGDTDLIADGEVFPAEFFIDDMGNVSEEGNIVPADCFTGVPQELAGKVVLLKAFGQFGISNCTADPEQKRFTLTIFNNHDPVAISQFQSLRTDGWTVKIVTDTALEESQLRTHERLHSLKVNNPGLRIAAYDLIVDSRKRPVQKIAEVFVTEMTPKNREMDGTEIDGWRVRVLELYENKRGNVGVKYAPLVLYQIS